ncbi:hypothetical protein COV19_07345 [Candidatus Woesearchaeota archaeon CG10_big_fil_rev_8_21_14_0_10_44_13]|nr:MAG: hypothetical protein COV19_07345 [Candidatus Woesearchaeota archaeon CG10_big_fil_rev_8_21_14_0_10_44_13]
MVEDKSRSNKKNCASVDEFCFVAVDSPKAVDDFDAVVSLMKQYFPPSNNEGAISDIIRGLGGRYSLFVAFNGEKPIAYMFCEKKREGDKPKGGYVISEFYAATEEKSRIYKRLMEMARKDAKGNGKNLIYFEARQSTLEHTLPLELGFKEAFKIDGAGPIPIIVGKRSVQNL